MLSLFTTSATWLHKGVKFISICTYEENKYVSALKIRSYADLVRNLTSHIKAAATNTVIRLPKKKKKKKGKKMFFAEYTLVGF